MSTVTACPTCGSGNWGNAQACWVCRTPLSTGSPSTPGAPYAAPGKPADYGVVKGAGLLVILVCLLLVTLLVGVHLAMEWPGLLIPYALVNLIVFAVLARSTFVHLGKPRARATGEQAESAPSGPHPNSTETGIRVVAWIVVGVCLCLLLSAAAVVLFFIVCLATLMH